MKTGHTQISLILSLFLFKDVIKTIKENKALGKNIRWFSNGVDRSDSTSSPVTASTNGLLKNADPLWDESVKNSSPQALNMECLLDLIEEWTSNKVANYRSAPLISNIHDTTYTLHGMNSRALQSSASMPVHSFDKAIRENQGEKYGALSGSTANGNKNGSSLGMRYGRSSKPLAFTNAARKRMPATFRRPKLRQSLSSETESDTFTEDPTEDICLLHMPKLCQFLHKLLQTPEDYKCIEWKDKATRTFKIVKPKEIAKLWGSTKHKPDMKYEHFARTLRGYVSRGLLRKPRQKLHYQFCDRFEQ